MIRFPRLFGVALRSNESLKHRVICDEMKVAWPLSSRKFTRDAAAGQYEDGYGDMLFELKRREVLQSCTWARL